MSFENLRDAILSRVRATAARTLTASQAQAAAEQARIVDRARELEEKLVTAAEQSGQGQAQQLRQAAKLAGRANVLAAKEAELDRTREAFIEDLKNDDPAALIAALVKHLPDEDGVIVPGEWHAAAVKRAAKGKTIADEVIPNDGGFIFRGKATELNASLRHLAGQLFKKNRVHIASRLFS